MYKYYLIALLLCISSPTHSIELSTPHEIIENQNSPIANFDGAPSSVVAGCVSVITGDFFTSSVDIIIPGTHPLIFTREYQSSDFRNGTLYTAWNHNFSGTVLQSKSSHHRYAVVKGFGSGEYLYKGKQNENETFSTLKIDPEIIHKGVTNCSRRIVGGQTNPNNNFMELADEGYGSITLGDGTKHHFTSEYDQGQYYDIDYEGKSLLRWSQYPDRTQVYQSYVWTARPIEGFFRKITLKNKSKVELAGLTMFFPAPKQVKKTIKNDKSCIVKLHSSDGRQVKWHFKKVKRKESTEEHVDQLALYRVERPNFPMEKYTYESPTYSKHDPLRMIRIENPDGRCREICYYKKNEVMDYRGKKILISDRKAHGYGRVKALLAPVGHDAKPIVTHRFSYKEVKNKSGKSKGTGYVSVHDACNHLTVFQYSLDTKRLKCVEKYQGNENHTLHSREKLTWGIRGSKDEINLLSRYIEDKDSKTIFCKSFEYHSSGNTHYERIWGNLTGKGTCPINMEWNAPVPGSSEYHEKAYLYSDDGLNLKTYMQDGELQEYYHYYPNSNLLLVKFTCGHSQLKQRDYYEYDDIGAVTLHIQDDGTSFDLESLENVHTRKITRFKNNRLGLPLAVIEKYYDFTSHKQKLLKRTVNSYDQYGRMIKQDLYDSNNCYAFSLSWEYDDRGNVISETDPLGNILKRTFDSNGNKLTESELSSGKRTEYLYDHANRLISATETHPHGTLLSLHYTYDYLGNKTSEIDTYGRLTLFEYDDFSNLIKTILPPCETAAGKISNPTISREYDTLGNISSITDSAGFITLYQCTIRGKPFHIKYPDGSEEFNEYSTKGELVKHVAKNGTTTCYTYDYQGRPIEANTFSPNGTLLTKNTKSYNAFNLLSETDPDGITTNYSYDGAGRLTVIEKAGAKTAYRYDSLGRKNHILEWFGDGPKDYIVKKLCYNLMGKVISETTEGSDGTVCKRVEYTYDTHGNQTSASIYNNSGKSTQQTFYNSRNEPITVLDGMGNKTVYTYRYDYAVYLGYWVPYSETTDPLGNRTIVIKNGLGLDHLIIKKNPMGKTTQHTEYRYDERGNQTLILETIFQKDDTEREISTMYEFDSMNRLVKSKKAAGFPEQQVTQYLYNSYGNMVMKTKPDGITISHTYDFLDRIVETKSSDSTIYYTYEYDTAGNPIAISDLANNTFCRRKYNSHHLVVEETQSSGLTIQNTYDRNGRIITQTYPDNSSVDYQYGSVLLEKIIRRNKSSEELYSFTIENYDLSGNPIICKMIGEAGLIDFNYDRLNRPKNILTKYWKEKDIQYDPAGNIIGKTIDDQLENLRGEYCYDDLYQITSEKMGFAHHYSNDSHFNQSDRDGRRQDFNALDELISSGDCRYSYDPNGNRIKKSGTQSETNFTYDAFDRLIEVTSGTQKTVYRYDPFNRRYAKEIYQNDSLGTQLVRNVRYLYADRQEIASTDLEGNFIDFRIVCSQGYCFAMEVEGKAYAPIQDHTRNITALIDASTGNLEEIHRYSSFKLEQTLDNNGSCVDVLKSPWLYSNKRYDSETGFIYFGERYYDPDSNRWITPDPIGREGGPNLYAYVLNNPNIFIDLFGFYEDYPWQQWNDQANRWNSDDCFGEWCWIYQHPPCVSIHDGHLFWDSFESGASESFNYNLGLVEKPGKGITFMNGIENSIVDNLASARHTSLLCGGYNVRPVYNATHGFCGDVGESIISLLGICTNPVRKLQDQWFSFFEENGTDALLLHYCHSQGAILTAGALASFPEKLRRQIIVCAIAPGGYINKDHCKDVMHYVSRDPIPLLDITGLLRAMEQQTVEFLGPHEDAPFWDHDYRSPTYEYAIKKHYHDYMQM